MGPDSITRVHRSHRLHVVVFELEVEHAAVFDDAMRPDKAEVAAPDRALVVPKA